MTIDDLKSALRDAAATPTSLEDAAGQARTLVATCSAAIETLSADRHRRLVEVSDEELEALDAIIAGERRTHDRALALADALKARKVEVEADLAERKRQDEIAAAHAKVAEFETLARKIWPAIVGSIHKLIAVEAEARLACEKAREHGVDIHESGWRVAHATAPAKILSETTLKTWANGDGSAVPLQFQGKITPCGDGTIGRELSRPNHPASEIEFHKADFVRIRWTERRTAPSLGHLAASIALPDLVVGQKSEWNPAHGRYALHTLNALDKLKEPTAPPAPPQIFDELVPVDHYGNFLANRGIPGSKMREPVPARG